MRDIAVGIIGSGFVAEIHAESLRRVPSARVMAVASPTEGKAAAFARKHGIPQSFTDYRAMLERTDVDVVLLCLPNDLHCAAAEAAAAAGKHVICEKPLCVTLEEADRMIGACRSAGVKLMYAEELCFTPKYVRAKELVDDGALGEVYLVKQSEKHDGPHSPWFWDVSRSGGGVRPGYTGGQMPVYMQQGKVRGPNHKKSMPMGPFRTFTVPVNVGQLEVFEAGAVVDVPALEARGLVKNNANRDHPVKILAEGELTRALTVRAHAFSAAARAKIEAAGGTAEVLGQEQR